MRLEARGHAKVNLGWEVGPLRPDGYHEVRGCLQTVSLCDTLVVSAARGGGELVRLVVEGPEALPELEGPGNLVVRAARLLGGEDPVEIRLTKRIPVGAGLGGGSADAAAALVALNVIWRRGLAAGDLVELGAGLGSDVPAILVGGLVWVGGRGEVVRSLGTVSGCAFVLGLAPGRLATADVYRRLDALGPRGRAARLEHNDLQAAAASLDPWVEAGLEAMAAAGAAVTFVSGSGPTVVGVVPQAEAAAAVAARASASGRFRRVETVQPTPVGVRLRTLPCDA